MAVESAHLGMMMTMTALHHQPKANVYNPRLEYGIPHPHSATTAADALLPMHSFGFSDFINPINNTAPLKADDSGLTCSLPISRKRSRDSSSVHPLLSFGYGQNMNQNHMDHHGRLTFLGKDISMQIQQQQQLEIDQLIDHHTEKVRIEVQERRKRDSKRIISAVEEGISKRLRAKEEEVLRIAKLNFALEERVKSLCVENQIWRELAQTHEATANALRSNLKQVLEHAVQDDYRHRGITARGDDAAALVEDAQSCCESNNEERRTFVEQDRCHDECTSSSSSNKRWCKKCGKEESCVLILPCRHLCLCTVCASSVNHCPLCKSTKNISLQVNMS